MHNIKENYNTEKQLNSWLPFPSLGEDIVRLLKGASTREDQQLVNLIILDMYIKSSTDNISGLLSENFSSSS